MSSFLCFVCHSTVNSDTNEEIREKYKEVVGMQLCVDSPLCHICCHVLRRLWLFRAVCLKRSLEYPVLFSEKGTLNLQRNDIEVHTICSEESCHHFRNRNVNSGTFHVVYEHTKSGHSDEYVQLHDDHNEFDDGFGQIDTGNDLHNDDANDHKYNDYENHSLEQSVTPDECCDFDAEDHNVDLKNHNTDTINHNLVKENREIDDYDHSIHDENLDFDTDNQNYEINTNNENIAKLNNDNNNLETSEATGNDSINETETTTTKTKKKSKKHKKKSFEKIILSLEEQKQELERRRKEKKYLEAEFKCHSCALSFLFKDTYQTHMMRHEESNGEYRCPTCTLRFASAAVLRSHTHSHGARYVCHSCGRGLGARARGTHRRDCWGEGAARACHLCGRTFRKHINRKFPCSVCGSQLSSPYSLAQHKKKHDDTQLHYCTTCGVTFTSAKGLRAHLNDTVAHRQYVKRKLEIAEEVISDTIECDICGRQCPTARALAAHTLTHTHAHTHTQHRCTHAHCHKQYATRKALRRHMNTHTHKGIQGKTAYCHYCGAGFKGNNKLNRHLREVCEKNKAAEEFATLYESTGLHPG